MLSGDHLSTAFHSGPLKGRSLREAKVISSVWMDGKELRRAAGCGDLRGESRETPVRSRSLQSAQREQQFLFFPHTLTLNLSKLRSIIC